MMYLQNREDLQGILRIHPLNKDIHRMRWHHQNYSHNSKNPAALTELGRVVMKELRSFHLRYKACRGNNLGHRDIVCFDPMCRDENMM
mmetsp:Transcript_22938/g.40926  ORF Transcript_22938/g.40926 Transcript_22938/m.40926 type:complete len:88 (+) Transcript_22938:712-975(+)